MDPLTQGTLGAALSQTAATPARIRSYALVGALAGLAPDLDILIRSGTDPLLYLEYHRQFTHSLVFIPVGAFLVALAVWPLAKRSLQFRQVYLAALLGYATHGLLDACTSYGTQLFWPFSDARIAWNWISIIDPLFSVPLFAFAVLAAIRRRPALAMPGLGWALCYLTFGALQQHRAQEMAESLAAERGHVPIRLSVKPGFANLLVWKSIYEADGRIHVDGIRAALPGSVCDGDSIRAFDSERDLPWLHPDSQQSRDLARFAWFSDGWLAPDPSDPNYVVDVRYAALPNRIEALWGLKVDEHATVEAHAVWHVVSSRRSGDLARLLDLLAGHGCRPLALPHPGG